LIEWTDATWNPWSGCNKVSAGCKNCYMFREKTRYGQEPNVVVRSRLHTFNLPLRLKEPQLVFTCSWSDFFIEEADPWRAEAWEIIRRTPHLTYQIVTKRIERAGELLPWGNGEHWPNVWLIVSAEDQATLDDRVPILLRTSAAVRGVSAEPLLGSMEIPYLWRLCIATKEEHDREHDAGMWCDERGLDWVIVGGESGPLKDVRAMDIAWAQDIVRQCREAKVACFVKQLGTFPVYYREVGSGKGGSYVPLSIRDVKGGSSDEWPEDLRVREFPEVRR
jgi:protein gp37